MNINTIIIDTPELLEELVSHVETHYASSSLVAIDTETDSVQARTARLYGIGLSFQPDEGFYLPFRAKDGTSVWEKGAEQRIASLLSHFPWKYLMHNGVYDIQVLRQNLGIDLTDKLYCDTILLKHTLDEERPHGLKESSVKYLGEWADKAQERLYANIEANGGTTTKTNLQMYKADTDVLAEYCVWDVCLTRQLYDTLEPRLDKENLRELFYNDEIMPLYKEVTIPMALRGFPVNVKHFDKLKEELQLEINLLEDKIQLQIEPLVESLCLDMLNEQFPPKRSGNFPKVFAQVMGVDLPINPKTGSITMSEKAVKAVLNPAHPYTQWLLEEKEDEILRAKYLEAQMNMFFEKFPKRNYVFNLRSNDHLGQLLFGILGESPVAETESGKPQVDEDGLEPFQKKYEWIKDLVDMKKLTKILSTYVEGVLDNQIDGVLYVSWKQFGTTSGRYSCSEINLQNLPRVKEDDSGLSEKVLHYTNKIKEGFAAPSGYKIVNSDYSQLEPCAFACASNEPLLQEVFNKKLDLYSSIAIKTFGLTQYSADKKDPMFLGKHKKEMRQMAKIFCLSSVYGASASRLKNLMNMPIGEVQKIIDDYFASYPKLKEYMEHCHTEVLTKGIVVSRYGRVRHIPRAKELYDEYGSILLDMQASKRKRLSEQFWELKNLRNLSTNHPIQSTAAYIVNKAMIATNRRLKASGVDGYIAASVHDEITLIVKDTQTAEASAILQDCMENTVKIEVPLRAEPLIGNNWAEAK